MNSLGAGLKLILRSLLYRGLCSSAVLLLGMITYCAHSWHDFEITLVSVCSGIIQLGVWCLEWSHSLSDLPQVLAYDFVLVQNVMIC